MSKRRKLGTGEPIYLYIEFSRGVYELYNQTFDSRIEANRFAETSYPGARYKVLSESEAQREVKRIEKRQQRTQKVKKGLVDVGKGFLEASYQKSQREQNLHVTRNPLPFNPYVTRKRRRR